MTTVGKGAERTPDLRTDFDESGFGRYWDGRRARAEANDGCEASNVEISSFPPGD